MVCVSSWLGPSSGKSVTAVLLAAEPYGAGRKLSIDDATANPDISRLILLPSTTPKQKLTPRLLVVGDFYRIRFRVRLTGQNESFVEVLLLQHVVDLHVDLAATQGAGTCTTVALPARERRIEAFGEDRKSVV